MSAVPKVWQRLLLGLSNLLLDLAALCFGALVIGVGVLVLLALAGSLSH